MIRYLTSGESHGPELTGIIEGIPAGVPVSVDDISLQLARRQEGYGRGGRMAFEKDVPKIHSGIRFGLTSGGPIAMSLENRAYIKDEANWPVVMSIDGDGSDIEKITVPRPGHADLVGTQKYRFDDIRPVIERSSARETGMRVACGAIARNLLKAVGIEIGGHVLRVGSVGYDNWNDIRAIVDPLSKSGAENVFKNADESEVRCLDPKLSAAMVDEIKKRRKEGNSLGGVYEIIITGVPAGLGSYVHWDRKLDGQLAHVIMGTQAMKGVEIGLGFESGGLPGSEVHDEIIYRDENFQRKTNRAGGIEGGMSNGMPIIIRGVMKPIPTMLHPIDTVDINTKEVVDTRYERSDVCALPRAVVVIENVIAPVIANAFLEKFGGDSLDEILERYNPAS
ncbi:MAG TPA: chorismate synthase [Bacteroidetes bacterium]|nr:chorismate synthase [Bacteroidota bacterium]